MDRHGLDQIEKVDQSAEFVDGEDFIFRFKVESDDSIKDQPFEELFQGTVLEILKYIRFFAEDKEVNVTGFAFRNNPGKVYEIYPEKSE